MVSSLATHRTDSIQYALSAIAEKLYARAPVPLQHVAISAYGVAWRHRRQGGRFSEFRDGFLRRERFSADQWRDWQTWRLREVLEIASRAPHYAAAWSAADLDGSDIASFALADLDRLPLLDKEVVRRDPDATCPGGAPARGASAWYTSGSTGTPLTTYHDFNDFRRGLAMRDARYETFLGITHKNPRATVRGRIVVPDPDSNGPYHRYNAVEKQTYLSPYHLGPRTVSQYVAALRKHRPDWLDGYASSIHDLAFLSLSQGLDPPPLKAVVSCAEPTTERLREDVQAAFGCKATEDYGLVEECCAGLECEHGRMHLFPDAGFVEILDDDGVPCPPGEIGEIVATSFLREAQPFVRYKTGDLAAWGEQDCPCGREMPVIGAIEGRLDDVLVAADGRRLGRLSTVPKHLQGVVLTQFVQERPGHVYVRVVAEGRLRDSVRDELRARLTQRLGSEFEVEISQVDTLERTSRGKIRSVVSSVAQRQ